MPLKQIILCMHEALIEADLRLVKKRNHINMQAVPVNPVEMIDT